MKVLNWHYIYRGLRVSKAKPITLSALDVNKLEVAGNIKCSIFMMIQLITYDLVIVEEFKPVKVMNAINSDNYNEHVDTVLMTRLDCLNYLQSLNGDLSNYYLTLYTAPLGLEVCVEFRAYYDVLLKLLKEKNHKILPEWEAFYKFIETLDRFEIDKKL